MRRIDAIQMLSAHRDELQRLGVLSLYLFGSVAREEARPDSDVDLFFDHVRGGLSLYALMEIKDRARDILGRPTDIITRSSLHPMLRAGIEASAVRIY